MDLQDFLLGTPCKKQWLNHAETVLIILQKTLLAKIIDSILHEILQIIVIFLQARDKMPNLISFTTKLSTTETAMQERVYT